MKKSDMQKIAVEISKERSGVPVLLSDLRDRLPGMNKSDFDLAVLTMAKNGYFLSKHFHPAQATEAERKTFIPDGEGGFYIAINRRDDIEIPKETPKAGPGRGGSREGAGRPMKKKAISRIPVQIRLSGWLLDWLKAERKSDMGKTIEQALIEKFGLKSPEE